MSKNLILPLVFILSLFVSFVPSAKAETVSNSAPIVISELQTSSLNELSAEDGRQEFVELHSQSAEALDVNGWKVQYFSASRLDVFDPNATPTRELSTLSGYIDELGYVILSFDGYLDNADVYFGVGSTLSSGFLARSGGHVRIINVLGEVVDVLGWGTAQTPETKAISEIKPNFSAQRIADEPDNNILLDTNNNNTDFINNASPTPLGGSLYEPIVEEEEEIIEEQSPIPPCDAIEITEILPNPGGTDSGQEFIELYNPSQKDIELQDCILKTSASTKQYAFLLDLPLKPGEYRAFYNSLTGLTLPNAAGGHVLLIGTTADYSTQYPENIEPNHTWANVDGQWYDLAQASPNAKNVLPPPAGETDVLADEEILATCEPGKFRNPETGRCKNIQIITTALTPCAIGQIRNAQTNRCRNISTLVSSLVPCKADQERNPETNRCKNVLGASTTLAPCQEGYERNSETKRCRKSATNNITSPIVGTSAKDKKPVPLDMVFMAVASTAVLGYGIYEYRRDFANAISRIKAWQYARRASK